MSTKRRTLSILAAVLLFSAVVLSAVAAQDATSTEEPPTASATAEATEQAAQPSEARPFLGVSLQDADSGVTVAEVLDGSAAADADVQAGDIITAINGTAVTTVEEVKSAVAGLNVGDEITIDVTRGDETLSLTATLGSQPAPVMQPRGGRGNDNRGNGNRGDRGMDQFGLSYDNTNQTWTITSLSEDNPLYVAGLREGDVITAIDGEAVDPASLFQHLQSLDADATVTVTVERDGTSQDIEIAASDLSMFGGFGGMRFGMGNLPHDFAQMMPMFGFSNGWLGVAYQTIDAQVAEDNSLSVTDGALITEVTEGSPAADAELQANDIVTAVNGEAVDAEHSLRDRMIAYEAGDVVTLTVLRDGASQDIQVTLGEPQMDMQGMFPNGFPFQMPNGMPFGDQPDTQPTQEAAPNA